ncbi:sigma factor-like helix-turn-helix DNA-binding protein [Paenibacillus filicis]|uniref:Sigma factor-like helix-turn-helix DNA-binding protein n=1 Tax=Paenibacillus filicis TaxID=669464 RepID=A0ABU9DVK9_9BACL
MEVPYEATATNYRKAKKQLEQLRNRITEAQQRAGLKEDHPDVKIIEGMMADCNYVIEWLTSNRRPGSKRGIERRATYQRDKLMDPIRMQAFVQRGTAGSPSNLTDWQRFQIDAALSNLSERERECYVMAHGDCFTHEQIARMLGISKGSVDKFVDRAHKKVSEEVQNSLFFRK